MTIAANRPVVVFLAANPDETVRLLLDEEVREIQAKLRAAEYRDAFEFRSRWAVRPDDLLQSLNEDAPTVVHFSGHGDGPGGLLFLDASGAAKPVTGAALAQAFKVAGSKTRVIVLNACESDEQAKTVAQAVDCVVGMTKPIGDDAARVFAASFYRALGFGKSVGNAFEQGRAAMMLEGTFEEDTPVLRSRSGVDPNAIFLVERTKPTGERERWVITLRGEVAELDVPAREAFAVTLQQQSGDMTLRIERIMSGTIRIIVNVSPQGGSALRSKFASGDLKTLCEFDVLGVESAEHIESDAAGPEWVKVEEPFLNQLASMGWKIITGSVDFPSVTGRAHFREVLIKDDLRKALWRINLRDKKPWLDDARVAQAVNALDRIVKPRLMEANQLATQLLLEGITVEGLPGWDGGRDRTIHFIDWERPENNTFTAVSQFKVDCPGQAKESIRPDITLFINGIPVVVIECKAPATSQPIPTAIDQLRRYHNARKAAGEVEENEGNERLFYTNQFLVATNYDEARVGTIGADAEFYAEWKDTTPVPLAQVQAELGKDSLSSQNKLIAGMLRPEHLLDIIRHFTLYQQVSGHTVKVVARYQQFRAVRRAIERLLHGKTRKQDGEFDRRGGIVWHTQGSGKSLTMVFLIRKIRSIPELRRFKVVFVTDRRDLERQLSETAALTGETVRVGRKIAHMKRLLSTKGPGLVFAMIQKYVDRDLNELEPDEEVGDLGLLNDDEAILVLVDEAHRSHTNDLHANLLQSLPNCARIGFTGTPIIMGAKKKTHDIFGEFIDEYTLKQSEADGATVPILYEGRTAEGAVADGRDLDQLFEDLLADRTREELEAIKAKYATRGNVADAEKMIAAKAADMLRHYVENILPSGLKAQVVANSREGAERYQSAFLVARKELVAEASALDDATRQLDDVALESKPRKVRAAVRAARHLDALKLLEFAAVFSPDNNDPPERSEWTDAGKIEVRIAQFKKPFGPRTEKADPLSFLIVKSMLLTGFDAPIEGVMYLDRSIREAELLQTIARVNRTLHGKNAGIVVDYYGVARHLKEALSAYDADDIAGALKSLKDEIPKLRDRHTRVLALFRSREVDPIADTEAAVALLVDERLRAEFGVKLKQFLATLDVVLPRPEGLPFVRDAATLAEVYTRARNRYREGMPQLGKSVGRKVQELIDEHVISLGIDPRIPPIAISDEAFASQVNKQGSNRAKASEMEHAIRHHIKKKLDEDPVHYRKLSERLEEILRKYGEDWEQLVVALQGLVEEAKRGRTRDESDGGLDPAIHAPFFDVLKEERAKQTPLLGGDAKWLADLTVKMVDQIIRPIVSNVAFWKSAPRQEELRGALFEFVYDENIVEFERADAVADRLMELTRANQHRLVKPE